MKYIYTNALIFASILLLICCHNNKALKKNNNLVTMYCDSIFYIENQECVSLRFRINYKKTGDTIEIKNPNISFISPVAESHDEGFRLVINEMNQQAFLLFSPMMKKNVLSKNTGSFDLILKCRSNIDSLQNVKKYKIEYKDNDNPNLISKIVLNKAEILKDNLIIK